MGNKIYNNPINLINGVKLQTLNFQDTRYEMEIIDNSWSHFLSTKQKDEELHEYTNRFFQTTSVDIKSRMKSKDEFELTFELKEIDHMDI